MPQKDKKYWKKEQKKHKAIDAVLAGRWVYYGCYSTFSDLINDVNCKSSNIEQMPQNICFESQSVAITPTHKLTYFNGALENSSTRYNYFMVNENLMVIYHKNTSFDRQQNITLFAYCKNNN